MLYSAARLLARQPQLCRFSTTRTLRQLVVEEGTRLHHFRLYHRS